MDSASYQILEGSEVLVSERYRILVVSGFLVSALY